MKKNHAFILIYFIATLFFCGCNFLAREVYPRYADFPEVITLSQAKSISCDSVYLRYPYRVEINDSLAVILDLHPDSCFLHAFTYPEWRYVTSFGSRGEGPEDILSAERVRISSPDSVWVLDSNRCQITRWRISNGNAERVEEIPLDDRLIRTLDFCKTADGFLVTDYTGNYRYHVLDQCGKIIQSVGHVPSEKNVDDSDKPALSQAWRSFMDYNPKNGVLAIVTQLGEVVELFILKTGEHKVYYGPGGEPVFSTLSSEAIPKGIKGFNDVVVSDSCIYTIFDGTPFKDRINSLRAGKKLPAGGNNIYVFGLDGCPLGKMSTECSAFGIEFIRGNIYTVGNDKDIPLYSYKCPQNKFANVDKRHK